jgi:WD40 repeat protein/serine/threonine protein kinase
MSNELLPGFVDVLLKHRFLAPARAEELTHELLPHHQDPQTLAQELVKRNWLTSYQAEHLVQGQVQELLIGPYVVQQLLGEGGMGSVYKARHATLGRIAAIKVLAKGAVSKPDVVARFQREMKAVFQLLHPNIVMAYDSGQSRGTYFLAMEFVEGTDLSKLVKQMGRFPIPLACECIRQAALGLQHAHERSLVHRDIKPSNLVLTFGDSGSAGAAAARTPVVKILDLGLARATLAGEEDFSSTLTQAGEVVGTPDFIAPEQARNSHTVDARADIYSLGCTMYFLLAGQVPFPGGSLTEKLLQHYLDKPKPVRELRPEVPAEVAEVLERLMAKNPDERYQTAGEVAWALKAFACADAMPAPLVAAVEMGQRSNGQPASAAPVNAASADTEPPSPATPVPAKVVDAPAAPSATPAVAARPPAVPRASRESFLDIARRPAVPRASRESLLDIKRRSAGSSQGLKAAEQLRSLASPFDQLAPERIATEERFAWQPTELVGVLGQHRLRHWRAARAVAVSPDGRLLASGGDDAMINLWSAVTGRDRAALQGHTKPVLALAFSPDGKTLVSASQDTTVRSWNVVAATLKTTFRGHNTPVLCLALDPTNGTLAAGSEDGVVKLWNATTGEELASWKHPKRVTSLAFAPDGSMLAEGSADGTVQLREPGTGQVARTIAAHTGWVTSLAFAPEGQTLVTSSADGTVKLWDVASTTEQLLLRGHTGVIYGVAFAPDGQSLATVGADGTVRLWSLSTKGELFVGKGHAGEVHGLSFTPDSASVATCGADGTVRLWCAATGKERIVPHGHTSMLYAVACAPDDQTVITASADGTARLWQDQKKHVVLEGHAGWVTAVAFAPAGNVVATASADGTAKLWSHTTGREQTTLRGHTGCVLAVAFAPDGRTVATSGADCTVRLWDPVSGQERKTLQRHTAWVTSLAFAPDGQILASASADACVQLWELPSAEACGTIHVRSGEVHTLAFAPDGRALAVGSASGSVKLWPIQRVSRQKGKHEVVVEESQRIALRGHADGVFAVAFAPDGKTLASASGDGMIVVWDLVAAKKLLEWKLPGSVQGLAFASDSRHLVTANGNGTCYILRLANCGSAH